MKVCEVIAIIYSLLLLQTSASFFDEVRGAVYSVENSFGKLLSDVIYDVRETIDCTLMAVEQVLALDVFGDPSDYERRCRDGSEPAGEPVAVIDSQPAPAPVQDTSHEVYVPTLSMTESRQVDSSILDVDEVLCDVLKKDDTHCQLEGVKLALKTETQRLNEISELLRKQLNELSAEVRDKLKAIELQTSEPSVESIWNDIKILHEIEHKHQNTAEAKKISHILDQILSILDANEEDRTTADDYKVREIMRKLSKNSKDGTSDLWKDGNDYPKDFREYANRIFEGSSATASHDNTSNQEKDVEKKEKNSEHTTVAHELREHTTVAPESREHTTVAPELREHTTVAPESREHTAVGPKSREHTTVESKSREHTTVESKSREVTTVNLKSKRHKTTTTTTEKPLTIEELAAEYGSLFDVMPDIESISTKHAVESAKNILEDSKVNEMVMNSLTNIGSNKAARNVFDDPELLKK